jgi:hypothetical protein
MTIDLNQFPDKTSGKWPFAISVRRFLEALLKGAKAREAEASPRLAPDVKCSESSEPTRD